jgi:ribonuclease HI
VPEAHDGPQAIIHVDGASRGNPGPAGAGVVIRAPKGDVLQEVAVPIARATNNVAEYRGLIEGLRAAEGLGLRRVEVRTDSELLFRQLEGIYRVKSPVLRRLHAEAVALMRRFDGCRLRQVRREENGHADRLASTAAGEAAKAGKRPPRQGRLAV